MRLFKFKIKKLLVFLKNKAGRNSEGKLIIRNRGGGTKKIYRLIDYKRYLYIVGLIFKSERVKNTSSTLNLVLYKNGSLSYIISSIELNIGNLINSFNYSDINKNYGSNVLLKNALIGSFLYNVELFPGKGGKFCRAGGSFCQIIGLLKWKHSSFVLIRLKSKQEYILNINCMGVLGIANYFYKDKYRYFYKAGQRRNLGWRPHVRGVAMNPVDHPHGGNTSGGRCSISIYGVLSKGFKTVKKKNNLFLKLKKNLLKN